MTPHDVILAQVERAHDIGPSRDPPAADSTSDATEERLARVLEAYLQDLEHGRPGNAERLLDEHPDLAESLRECLSGLHFLHEAAAGLQKDQAAGNRAGALPFDCLGDFQLVREIGRGGMGIVYEARQISLDRRVALKVLPFAAMFDEKQIARFANEARAAAQLQHPHIVPVFSVGFERGVHFFSMQYVDGQPLSRIIRELRQETGILSTDLSSTTGLATTVAENVPTRNGRRGDGSSPSESRGRLHWRWVAKLGLQAADALDSAHQCNVIHRDIKPSNLLVDRAGKLWVADFGLARCPADSNLTATGGLLGTLNYMSPEQAAGQGNRIDARTDIYSLGVTLYELLTLRKAFIARNHHDLLRQILEDEPPRPRSLNPAIPVDLETIVLKATAKSARRRYATVRHLADDLERFLDGRPILARRATVADHLRKWAGRHKSLVYAGLGLLLVAVLAMAVATTLIARAQARTHAAWLAAQKALEQSEQDRRRSEQWFRQAREVLNRLAKRHAEELRELPQAEGLRRELLRDSIGYYRSFIRSAADDPALRADLAAAYFQTGKLLERLPETNEALAAYENAQETLTQLVEERPGDMGLQADLALCHNNLGVLLLEAGATSQARAALRQAVDTEQRLSESAPENERFRFELALSLGNLGSFHQRQGDVQAAEEAYRKSLALGEALVQQEPREPRYLGQMAMTCNDLGLLLAGANPIEAERLCRRALATLQTLAALRPNEAEIQADLALCHGNLGSLLRHAGKTGEAEASYHEAIATYKQLVHAVPTVGRYQCELATAFSNLGVLYLEQNQAASAHEALEDARHVLDALAGAVPEAVNYRSYLGGVLSNLGTALAQLGQEEEAEQAYRRGIDAQRYAVEHAPDAVSFRRLLASQCLILGRFLDRRNRADEANELRLVAHKLQASP